MPETYIPQKIVVHGHCHHKSVLKLEDEIDILRQVAQEVEVIDSGCCGMAGAFGYEKHKYAVSETIAEQRLMPAVRQQSFDTIILADGFSCRNQINHFAHRQPITMPELLLNALKGNAS